MDFKSLKDNKLIKSWLSGIGAKKTTMEGYTDSLRVYTDLLEKTPEQIILAYEEDIRSGKLMRERKIFEDMEKFTNHLNSSGMAPASARAKLNGVTSFFRFYNIQMPFLPKSGSSTHPLLENLAIPSKEDIREALIVADPLEKALVLVGASSGLAIAEISNLTVRQFTDGYDPETEITTLHLIREKVGYEFYTFLTPEASRAVWNYIEYRNRTSDSKDKKRQAQLTKQRVKYDKEGKPLGYLFISRSIYSKYFKINNEKAAEEMRRLKQKSIEKAYRELNLKAGMTSTSGKRNLLRSHNVRKFFNSTLLANGEDIFTTDFLMGHKIDRTHDAYFRADPKALREKYKNFIPYLTIQKELNISESPEYQRLKNENEILARETARTTVERVEIQELRNELTTLKEQQKQEAETRSEINELLKNPVFISLIQKINTEKQST